MKAYTLEIDFAQFGITEEAKVPLASTMVREEVDYDRLADKADGYDSLSSGWGADLISAHLRGAYSERSNGNSEVRLLLHDVAKDEHFVLRLKGVRPMLAHPKVPTCCRG